MDVDAAGAPRDAAVKAIKLSVRRFRMLSRSFLSQPGVMKLHLFSGGLWH